MRRLAGALRRHGDVLVALGFAVLMSLELLSGPHVAAVLLKLELRDRVQIVVWAFQNRLR
jgi:hypothetical protein